MWLGGFDGKCRISDIENAYNTVATQIRIVVVERQTPEPRRQVGMTDVRWVGRVGNIINTQTVTVVGQISVSAQDSNIKGAPAKGKSAVVGVSDVERGGRVGNIVNAQAVSAVRQVSIVARDNDTVRSSAVVSVTDVNRIDLGGNRDHPTTGADEGEERPQNSSRSFHGASRRDV